jgi:cell division protein FtsB
MEYNHKRNETKQNKHMVYQIIDDSELIIQFLILLSIYILQIQIAVVIQIKTQAQSEHTLFILLPSDSLK